MDIITMRSARMSLTLTLAKMSSKISFGRLERAALVDVEEDASELSSELGSDVEPEP